MINTGHYYEAAGLIVLFAKYEGFGCVAVEALGRGLAIVSARHPCGSRRFFRVALLVDWWEWVILQPWRQKLTSHLWFNSMSIYSGRSADFGGKPHYDKETSLMPLYSESNNDEN